MTDIRLKERHSLEAVTMDWLLRADGTLDEREELASSVRVALGTDRLSAPNEILPDLDSTDRRGWWGDMEAEEVWDGWQIGCRNWLLLRAKITDVPSMEGSTLERARTYTYDSLRPFIDKRVVSAIEVEASRTTVSSIEVHVTLYRGPKEEIDLRYQLLWEPSNLIATDVGPTVVEAIPPPHWRVPPKANLILTPRTPTRVP